MKNGFLKISVALMLMLACFFVFGCNRNKIPTGRFTEEEMAQFDQAEREDLPKPTAGLVLNVGGEIITIDEILAPAAGQLEQVSGDFRQKARSIIEEEINKKVTDILLYQIAKTKAPAGMDEKLDSIIEQEVNRFVAGYGSNYAKAETALKDMGMNWQSFRSYQRKLIMTQFYISKEVTEEKPITHGELLKLYESVREKNDDFQWDAMIEFRLIDINLEEYEDADGLTAQEVARKKAEEVLAFARDDKDFAKLAEKHSNGRYASKGGLWKPVTPGSLAEPYDAIERAVLELNPGQVSGLIAAKGHYFIAKLEKKREAGFIPFEQVQDKLEYQIRMFRRQKQLGELLDKLVQNANIAGLDDFVTFCVENAYSKYGK